jgi:hypothetical protein
MKSFGTLRCQLCMEEKLAILHASSQQPDLLLNSLNEIDEGCIVSVDVQTIVPAHENGGVFSIVSVDAIVPAHENGGVFSRRLSR